MDTGADVTLLPLNMLQEHLPDQLQHIQPTEVQACTVSKTALPLSGTLPITFQLGSPNNQITIKHYCLISPATQHPILGQDFLSRASAIINFQSKTITLFGNQQVLIPVKYSASEFRTSAIYSTEECIIPPGTVCQI